MFKKIIINMILMLVIIFPLHAKDDSGKNLILFGNSASSLGRGGTGVTGSGSDLFYLNPASIAPLERIEFGAQYGTLGFRYSNPDISFALPSSYGVFGGSFRMIDIPSDAADMERGYLGSLGGAKNFSDRLMFGLALNYFNGTSRDRDMNYAGAVIGSIYKINFETYFIRGFGIYEPDIGFSVNAGIPFGKNDENADFNQATAGYSFSFYRSKDLDLKFYNDFSAINTYKNFPAKFGFESLIMDSFTVRAGFTAPQSYDYGDFTLGLGYLFKTENFTADINYSLVHYSKWNFVHYLGLNLKYGQLDRDPPETDISANEEYISPNYDGRADFLIFKTEVHDTSKIKGWKLQIVNPDNRIIREYRVSERDIDESLSIKGFFTKIWQKKESLVVPEIILWDGTDFGKKIVPDGKYTYLFTVWDERDNISSVRSGTVYVDNTPPEVTIESDVHFSPNGDRKKDTLDIKLSVITSKEDEWKAGFIDSEGTVIKSYAWNGSSVPNKIVWDGTGDKGNEAPEGLYNFFVGSADKAGNRAELKKKQISLRRKYQNADITCSDEYFSYEKNKNIMFYPYISDTKGLENWKITILDDGGDLIKEITGGKDIPETAIWHVLDLKDKKLEDGIYYFKLEAKFDSGNTPESFLKKLIIDSTPPVIDLSYSPDLFSPDDDGENDILAIYPEAGDNEAVKDWGLDIIEPSGKIFKSFSGKGSPPAVINWDGIGRDKELVESAADYFLVLNASDLAGNSVRTKQIKLPIDVLVTVTERGLKIRISNIEFAFDMAKLTERAFPILNRVNEILGKYDRYSVLIEGHTDDAGIEEYNLKLSEARAKTVMDYLISKDIDEKRLTFRGMGETMPFLPNTDSENRRRNRRVEFLLLKDALSGQDK